MRNKAKNHFKTLGVSRDASLADIKDAHRKLVKEHHPDRNPDSKEDEERFKEIQSAYDYLKDPSRLKEHRQALEREDEIARKRRERSVDEAAASAFGDAIREQAPPPRPPPPPQAPSSPRPTPASRSPQRVASPASLTPLGLWNWFSELDSDSVVFSFVAFLASIVFLAGAPFTMLVLVPALGFPTGPQSHFSVLGLLLVPIGFGCAIWALVGTVLMFGAFVAFLGSLVTWIGRTIART